jgi:hypothetical protein
MRACISCQLLTEALAIERQRVDRLLGQLTPQTQANAPLVEMPEPDSPPDVVMAAMKQISPTKDRAYEANYAYWENNKERAKAYPAEFADEIIAGIGAE